ncbi:hypothetical protein BCR34DRAFT_496762 [Clohesyomyces aquaticus]|uniref:Uncharacterized protein n=1 Tax=Clohesyomyces aquaticus TaxID=1231657 RepID=A0A1Y1YHU6_9PLEO|nr:hypothetical protein BCR34DRAFT_496762 [Clohesyomyces aquaticus]
MSNDSQYYYTYHHQQQQPQVLLAANAFGYGQYDPQRSKTPTSLINHTGHSPGPLSTPPQSRNASQPPEQAPGQMIWENARGSPSDSPTSVKTPDNDPFDEVVMLDAPLEPMGNVFPTPNEDVNGQIPPLGLDASLNLWTDQDLQNFYNTSAANLDLDQPQFTLQFSVQHRDPQGMQLTQQSFNPQPFNNGYGQEYTNQPSQQDPWTSQRPSQNPNVPQSDAPLFGPAADMSNYARFINPNVLNGVAQWNSNVAASAYNMSPTGSMMSSMDGQFYYQDQSPVEVNGLLPSPVADSQGFVNLHPTSPFFANDTDYNMEPQYPPSSPGNSTIAQVASPFRSVSSLDGHEGSFATQYLDQSARLDTYPGYRSEQGDVKPVPPPSPVQVQPSPGGRTVPEITYDSHSPDSEHSGTQQSNKCLTNRPGGRALGTHLEPKVAKAAHDMRKIVACWHCVLQRDKCGPGDICERCLKRSQRPNSDCGLGCSRVKLVELTQWFIPTLLSQMHEDATLTEFVRSYIHQWTNAEITVYMTCGQDSMPRIPVKVYEFLPKTRALLSTYQYITDPVTHKSKRVEKMSPALGMVHIHPNEEKKYDKYINEIVDHHLDAFADLCWQEDDNDFQQKLFKLMTKVKPRTDDEAKLLKEVFRLIVVTYIMSHVISIAEETKAASLRKMHGNYDPAIYVEGFTTPRMTNRQLKYFFARLQKSILATVLNKLQQFFKSSKGCDRWMAAFITVIGLGMAHEDQQKTLHVVMETKTMTEGVDFRAGQANADFACGEIDKRMGFISQIFRWKYNRKCNPLRDSDHDWEGEVGFGDQNSVEFVRGVAQLVKDNSEYLTLRQAVNISYSNQTQYTSRLVGKFLLSFWLPS